MNTVNKNWASNWGIPVSPSHYYLWVMECRDAKRAFITEEMVNRLGLPKVKKAKTSELKKAKTVVEVVAKPTQKVEKQPVKVVTVAPTKRVLVLKKAVTPTAEVPKRKLKLVLHVGSNPNSNSKPNPS